MTTQSAPGAGRLLRSPMMIIFAGGLVLWLSIGTRQSFGLFMTPMTDDLGWGREIFALAIAIQNIVWGITQPIAGALADRWGAGRTIVGGAILYGAGIYLMASSSTPEFLYLSGGLIIGIGLSGTSFAVVMGAVGRAVSEEKRSMALGIVGAAGSLGQFVMVPVGQAFIANYGWSVAFMILGVLSFLMLPLAAGVAGKPATDHGADSQTMRQGLGEALRLRSYWYLIAGFFVCGFHVTFIGTHLPSYLQDQGLDQSWAAWALALVGLFNIIGSLGCGWLGGRYPKKYVLSTLYVMRAVIITIFLMVPVTPVTALMFGAGIGLMWLATVPLTTGLVATIFGPKYLGMLSGLVFFSHQIGAFLGVWWGGYLFDTTGSYDVIWWVAVALGVLAAVLHWPIEERLVTRPAQT